MKKYILDCNENYQFIPNRKACIELIKDIRNLIFPGYFIDIGENNKDFFIKLTSKIKNNLTEQITKVSLLSNKEINAPKKSEEFISELPNILKILKTDLEATFNGDPAAEDYHEIIISYPGFFAISVYRIAHLLHSLKVPYLPRILSEYAHNKTGIDIHPGATIGEYFFIDHGTGIVIGETAIIGHHVKIYQGVTIGALSLGRGQQLRGNKRHPTIGNFVTIYAGASILGGETIIGDNVTIGSNTYILESIQNNSIVRLKNVEMEIVLKNINK